MRGSAGAEAHQTPTTSTLAAQTLQSGLDGGRGRCKREGGTSALRAFSMPTGPEARTVRQSTLRQLDDRLSTRLALRGALPQQVLRLPQAMNAAVGTVVGALRDAAFATCSATCQPLARPLAFCHPASSGSWPPRQLATAACCDVSFKRCVLHVCAPLSPRCRRTAPPRRQRAHTMRSSALCCLV